MDALHVDPETFEKARDELQRTVLAAVQKFEESVNLEVTGLDPIRAEIFGQRKSPVVSINVSTELPTWFREGRG